MDVDAILCDHAQTADGKLFISGGGLMRYWVDPQPPYMVALGIGAVAQVPYTATGQAHIFTVALFDEDGHPVVPFGAEDTAEVGGVEASVPFELGRPPGLSHGEAQPYCLAVNFTIALRELGGYAFEIKIDDPRSRT